MKDPCEHCIEYDLCKSKTPCKRKEAYARWKLKCKEIRYNKSHAPDPTARDAITAADEMPVKISDTIKCIKILLRMNNLELAKRVQIRDKETGRTWK